MGRDTDMELESTYAVPTSIMRLLLLLIRRMYLIVYYYHFRIAHVPDGIFIFVRNYADTL